MTHDLHRILASKQVLRRQLAELPVAEKLHLLDVLRERALSIRKAAAPAGRRVAEKQGEYHVKGWP
jgi:hypothetical protein